MFIATQLMQLPFPLSQWHGSQSPSAQCPQSPQISSLSATWQLPILRRSSPVLVSVRSFRASYHNAHNFLVLNFAPGYHPWFTYQISMQPTASKDDHYRSLFLQDPVSPHLPDHVSAYEQLLPSLPEPIPLDDILSELRRNLEAFPGAMLGEVGLDRMFRVPFDYNAAPRQLTPFTVPFDHQLAILEAQLDLAVTLGRNVSMHSVKAQLATADLLAKMRARHQDSWVRISVDLHSCGLSPETWRDIEA